MQMQQIPDYFLCETIGVETGVYNIHSISLYTCKFVVFANNIWKPTKGTGFIGYFQGE